MRTTKQTGQSREADILCDITKQLEQLIKVISIITITTTTTIVP